MVTFLSPGPDVAGLRAEQRDVEDGFCRGIEAVGLLIVLPANDISLGQGVFAAKFSRVLDPFEVAGLQGIIRPIRLGPHVLEAVFMLNEDFHEEKLREPTPLRNS